MHEKAGHSHDTTKDFLSRRKIMAKSFPIVFLTLAVVAVGCEAKILADRKCIRCNEDGTKPGECDTVKEPTLCDPPDSYVKKYKGCATIIGKGSDGKNVVTKSCAADCNQKGIANSGFGREVDDKECISLDKRQSEDAQSIWRDMGKHIQTNYEEVVEFCFCSEQACNVTPIGNSIAGSGTIRPQHFLYLTLAALAVIFGFWTQ